MQSSVIFFSSVHTLPDQLGRHHYIVDDNWVGSIYHWRYALTEYWLLSRFHDWILFNYLLFITHRAQTQARKQTNLESHDIAYATRTFAYLLRLANKKTSTYAHKLLMLCTKNGTKYK